MIPNLTNLQFPRLAFFQDRFSICLPPVLSEIEVSSLT